MLCTYFEVSKKGFRIFVYMQGGQQTQEDPENPGFYLPLVSGRGETVYCVSCGKQPLFPTTEVNFKLMQFCILGLYVRIIFLTT